MFKDRFNELSTDIIKKLELNVDDDSLKLSINIDSICKHIDPYVACKVPEITSPYITELWGYNINISLNEEIFVFMCFICKNDDQYTNLMTILENALTINMIKVKMLQDYLSGNSTFREKEYISIAEKFLLKNKQPRWYIDSFEYKLMVFFNAFFYNEYRNKHHYLPLIDKDLNSTYEWLVILRLQHYGFESAVSMFDNDRKQFKQFNEVLSLYGKFNQISSISDIEKIRKEVSNGCKYSKKLICLLDELIKIYHIWNKIKKSVIKNKWRAKYKDTIENIPLYCMNSVGIMQAINDEYKQGGSSESYYRYMTSRTSDRQLVQMVYKHTALEGERMVVYLNIDVLLSEYINNMFDDVTLTERLFHYEFALKHEMGHIIHKCALSDERDKDHLLRLIQILDNDAEKQIERYNNLPDSEKPDYLYWYYTDILYEFIANDYMKLTIEDVYRANFKEVPPEVKRLLKES